MKEIVKKFNYSLIELLIKIAKKLLKDKSWKELFVSTAHFLSSNPNNRDYFNSELEIAFSEKRIEDLSKKYRDVSGYYLRESLTNEFRQIFNELDLDYKDYNVYINNFLDVVFDYLKMKRPDIYREVFISDFKKECLNEFQFIKNELTLLGLSIKELRDKKIYTISEKESFLRNETINDIELDFFSIDDPKFKKEFKDCIESNQSVHIKCDCNEEALYEILNEIKRNYDIRTLIIESKDDWDLLFKKDYKGNILIPFFDSDEIYAIPNNINIFLYEEDEPEKALCLKTRREDTVINSLIKYNYNKNDAYSIYEETSGVYSSLKSKLFKGKFVYKYPDTINENENILFAILVGEWIDGSRDCEAFKNYSDVKRRINSYYSKGRNPLFKKIERYGHMHYKIANRKKAIRQYIDSLGTSLLYLINKTIEYINNEKYSPVLKKSILKSLLIMKYDYNNMSSKIDETIKKVLFESHICSFERVCIYLMELNPAIFLEAFKKRIHEVIKSIDDAFYDFFGALRVLIRNKAYAKECVNYLIELKDEDFSEQRKVYFYNFLSDIFCPWFNIASITYTDKINILEAQIKNNHSIWNLVFDCLDKKTSITYSDKLLSYFKVDDLQFVTNKERFDILVAYLNICVDNISSSEELSKVLDTLCLFDNDIVVDLIRKIRKYISLFDDNSREIVFDNLHEIVYRHRFFNDSSWAMSEENLKVYLDLINSISFEKDILRYKYIFKYDYDFPLLNPVPFNDLKHQEKNEYEKIQVIRNVIEKMREGTIDLYSFINLYDDKEKCTLGSYVFELYDNGKFNDSTLSVLIKTRNLKVIRDYSYSLSYNDYKSFKQTIMELHEFDFPSQFIASIWTLRVFNEVEEKIENEDEDVKKYFWNNFIRFELANDKVFEWVRNNYLKYGSYGNYSELLYLKKNLPNNLLFDYLTEIKDYSGVKGYYIEELLSRLYDYVINDFNKMVILAEVELSSGFHYDRMVYLKFVLEHDPHLYLEYLKETYLDDDGLSIATVNNHKSFAAFYLMSFCPGYNNERIDKDLFDKWIDLFKDGLKKNNQISLLNGELGKLFAHSPIDDDGYYPDKIIRDYIEKNYSDDLVNSFISSTYNKRGVHNVTGGDSEYALALSYKENADSIRSQYPNVAKIYDKLHNVYIREFEIERNNYE